jgi:integrase
MFDGVMFRAPETFREVSDARAWLEEEEKKRRRGTWVDPHRVTLADYAPKWVRGRHLGENTLGKYNYLLRGHILPELGDAELGRLTPADIRAWYNVLRNKYESVGDDAYRLLRAILHTAVEDHLLAESPCKEKGAGTVRTKKRPVWSREEAMAALEAVPERYRAAVVIASWCQLRRGELLGLQRRHINLATRTMTIEQAWVVPHGKRPILKGTKSEAGERIIAIPPDVVPWVEAHLKEHVDPQPRAWVFATRAGNPMAPRNFYRFWEHAREKAGRPELSLHDLRRSGLTWYGEAGATLAELMYRGGHGDVRSAMIYQVAQRERDKALAGKL